MKRPLPRALPVRKPAAASRDQAIPSICGYECPFAAFPPAETAGICRTMAAVWCANCANWSPRTRPANGVVAAARRARGGFAAAVGEVRPVETGRAPLGGGRKAVQGQAGAAAGVKEHIHYEAAFEHYLRQRGIAYVLVNESKKSAFRDFKLKSFDFIVYSSRGVNWLTDIKGRRWAARRDGARPAWENWVTQADLDGLSEWQRVFGAGFRGLLVFAYWLQTPAEPPAELVHAYHDDRYVFAGVPLDDYASAARIRSPKWGTVNMPVSEFARFVRPIEQWI